MESDSPDYFLLSFLLKNNQCVNASELLNKVDSIPDAVQKSKTHENTYSL